MNKYLLLIDDDEDEELLFSDALRELQCNYKCLYAKDALQAIQWVNYVQPEIVFVDLNMPRINGFECIKQLRKLPPLNEVPIILYSNGINENDIKTAENIGATLCVQKPDNFNVLKQKIYSIIEKYRMDVAR